MSPFQIVILLVVAGLVVITVAAAARGWTTRRMAALLVLGWLAAGAVGAWPEAATRFAGLLGVGRGADLVLYCGLLVTMLGFLMGYVRIRRLRRQLTLLVREMAMVTQRLEEVEGGEDPKRRSDEAT